MQPGRRITADGLDALRGRLGRDDGRRGTEHRDGWLLVGRRRGRFLRRRHRAGADERVPRRRGGHAGLVNTHHHLYQTLTRARAQQADLFTWLRELYPVWARIDAEAEYAAARTGIAELALSGCTTVFDHHYVFPRGRRVSSRPRCRQRGSSAFGSSPRAARWTSASRTAGFPRRARRGPRRGARGHGAPGSGAARARPRRTRSARRRSVLAVLGHAAADAGVGRTSASARTPLHTIWPRRSRRTTSELHGCTPVEYLDSLGWLAEDVWCAHCVHLADADVERFGRRAPASVRPRTCGSAPASRRFATSSMPMYASGWASTAPRRTSARPVPRGQAGAPRRPRARRRRIDPRDRPAARHPRRGRPAAVTISARWSPASRPTSPPGRRTVSSLAARTTSSPRSSSPARTGSTGSSSAARTSCAAGRSCGPTRRSTRAPPNPGHGFAS